MPAPQVSAVQRIKGIEFGGYFALKSDYKNSPIREAAEGLLLMMRELLSPDAVSRESCSSVASTPCAARYSGGQ
jgi:hypothetical protein